jgi:hypothetical protein
MSADDPLLDPTAIENAFRRLGDRLARRGVVADLYTFGGAAMALAYDARRATRDIEGAFQPHGIVVDEARVVADELGLPRWWLASRPARMSPQAGIRQLLGFSITRAFECRPHRPSGALAAPTVHQ